MAENRSVGSSPLP
jgi:hypothetical protein